MPATRRKRKSADEEGEEIANKKALKTETRTVEDARNVKKNRKRNIEDNCQKFIRKQTRSRRVEKQENDTNPIMRKSEPTSEVSDVQLHMSKLRGPRVKVNESQRKCKNASPGNDHEKNVGDSKESMKTRTKNSRNLARSRKSTDPKKTTNGVKAKEEGTYSRVVRKQTEKLVDIPVHVDSESDDDFEEVGSDTEPHEKKVGDKSESGDHDIEAVDEPGKSESDDDFEDVDDFEIGPEIKRLKKEPETGSKYSRKSRSKGCEEKKVVKKNIKRESDRKKKNNGERLNNRGKKCELQTAQKSEKMEIPRTSYGKDEARCSVNNDKLMQESDVATVLMQMEGSKCIVGADGSSSLDRSTDDNEDVTDEDQEESDWEEVADHPMASPAKSQIPDGPVQIRLEVPDIMKKKRQKKRFDWKSHFNRLLNRFRRELQLNMHKVHLLCLLSHGIHCSRVCMEPVLQGQALSLVPLELLKKRPRSFNIPTLNNLVTWFTDFLPIDAQLEETGNIDLCTLQRRFAERKVASEKENVMLFLILLRVLGLETRLVISLQPVTMKTSASPSKGSAKNRKKSGESVGAGESPEGDSERSSQTDKGTKTDPSRKHSGKKMDLSTKSDKVTSKYFKDAHNVKLKRGAGKSKVDSSTPKLKDKRNQSSAESKSSNSTVTAKSDSGKSPKRNLRAKNNRKRSHASKISQESNSEEMSDDSDEYAPSDGNDSNYSNFSDDERKRKSKSGRRRNRMKGRSREDGKKEVQPDLVQLSSDGEFEDVQMAFRKSPTYQRKSKGKQVSKKVISSDSDDSVQILKANDKKKGCDYWVEVFLDSEEKWICVDVIHQSVNKPGELERRATQPISYVLAFHNDGSVKDLTSRYASHWMSHTRKLRIDSEWWQETLAPYRSKNIKRDESENLQLKAQLMKKPLPLVIGEFKDHPLYALRRHLLKFEAIYPETSVPLGYIKKEPVYARECVHTLHSRENWLKEGQVVKVDETPYKMVKSRPKWNKPKENPDELDLGLYGLWQTELYVPPPAKDGKVYRNEYGNVELFKPSMLPAGTVHMRVQGLNKVAKKLDIDCVPAMVGWEHHSGFAHPILDGFVVCEEHEDILLSAWEEDQELQRQKEAEKRDKRVKGNWKLLVRGLLIRERLKKRFDLEKPKLEESSEGSEEKAMDAAMSWPRNRQKHSSKAAKDSTSKCLVEVEKL